MNFFRIIKILLLIFFMGTLSGKKMDRLDNKTFYGFLSKVGGKIEKKYNLTICGSGSGSSPEGYYINKFILSFNAYGPLSHEQLRKLLIECANELVREVNLEKKLEPFLIRKPYPIQNVQIIVFNYDKHGGGVKDPLITVAQISNGILTFRTRDPENDLKYKNNFKETYEEVLEKLKTAPVSESKEKIQLN
ncbi:hypothetical protein [Parachlamydia sp. AcF125]|uniref:hypothetical protein n=1 Tax=Parachlamydia sp. AcF125 TaxID=2795736 RepID=UPI001BC96A81|nr:hypothetical protein [Parachlamydia sp. AcF125]MBS4168085.1 hypothetical protein [Parachlamydia sp. AcF125]